MDETQGLTAEETLLKEIRDRFDYCVEQWEEVRREGSTDMKFISGDPWDPKERQARKEANRPCLCFDELSQYINQRVNDCRMNKRAIKVVPKGNGANDKTAELRGDYIRTLESDGGQAAYTTAFENVLMRSYGYFRISKHYEDNESDNQTLKITRIPNPDVVYVDPDFKEADASDIRYAFIVEEFTKDEFKERWPDAKQVDFPAEWLADYPNWVKEKSIQVAEYWKVKTRNRTLYYVGSAAAPTKVYKDELPKGVKADNGALVGPEGVNIPIVKSRKVKTAEVIQYITNGVEILEENPWEGKYIPVVCMFGKEMWIEGKRRLISLTRLARDPVMLYNYARTCEAEIVGMAPKAPWVIAEGQIEGHESEWQNANKVPLSVLVYKPQTDATGERLLPAPQRQAYEPPIQATELLAESARRAIQAAMGIMGLPTAAQRRNEKSGVALERIQNEQAQGSYHFFDIYDGALKHAGRIIDDMFDKVIDTPRELALHKEDDSHEVAKVNQPVEGKDGKTETLDAKVGDHKVTITTGPSYQSQREAAGDFVDILVQNLATLPIDPVQKSKILSLSIKMKQLGVIGDKMAKILDPEEQEQNPQAAALKLQQAMGMVQAMTEQLNQLTTERDSKAAELASKEKIAAMQAETQLQVEKMKLAGSNQQAMLDLALQKLQMQIDMMMQNRQLDINAEQANRAHDLQVAQAADKSDLQRQQMDQEGQFRQQEMDQAAEQAKMAQEQPQAQV